MNYDAVNCEVKDTRVRWKPEAAVALRVSGTEPCAVLPYNSECAITDGPVRLHLCGARHLAGGVAEGLRHRRAAAGASTESCGVTWGPGGGGGSGEARCGAEARGGSSAGRADTEILVAQLRARKQVSTHGLPARAVKCHPPRRWSRYLRLPARLGEHAAPRS